MIKNETKITENNSSGSSSICRTSRISHIRRMGQLTTPIIVKPAVSTLMHKNLGFFDVDCVQILKKEEVMGVIFHDDKIKSKLEREKSCIL